MFPLSYIEFAKEETNLFRLLFISDMDLDMSEANDFYKELGNEEKAKAFSQIIGVEPKQGKEIFLDLFLYSHGIAVLTATGKLSFDSLQFRKNVAKLPVCICETGKRKGWDIIWNPIII